MDGMKNTRRLEKSSDNVSDLSFDLIWLFNDEKFIYIYKNNGYNVIKKKKIIDL